MSEQNEIEFVTLQPVGENSDEVEQPRELETVPISEYTADGNNERVVFRPKTLDEINGLRRGIADLRHRNLITWAGLVLIFLVTLAAIASFLGITFSTAQGVHEDAVRLLLLIIGAVLGAVFGATVLADNERG